MKMASDTTRARDYVTHYELELYKDYTEKRLDRLDEVSNDLKKNTDDLNIQMRSIDSNIARLNDQIEDFTDNIGSKVNNMVDNLEKNVDTRLDNFDDKLDSFDDHIKHNREDIDDLTVMVNNHDGELKTKQSNLKFWGILIPAAISGIVTAFTALLQFLK